MSFFMKLMSDFYIKSFVQLMKLIIIDIKYVKKSFLLL